MLKFMLIVEYVHDASALFFDNYNEALKCAHDAECGLGALWQMYEWDADSNCYKFLQD